MRPGESIELDPDAGVLGLCVLPSMDGPMSSVVNATLGYAHKCCEQTAAKMLSAAAAWALSDPRQRQQAEETLLAGVTRMETMWLEGRGFKMYPVSRDEVCPYWSPKATRHLIQLLVLQNQALSPALEHGLVRVQAMAVDTAAPQQIELHPTQASTLREAYSIACASEQGNAALDYVRGKLDLDASPPTVKGVQGRVEAREGACYAAATLLRAKDASKADLEAGIALANAVTQDLGPNGRLYSTVDSIALVALLGELRTSRLLGGGENRVFVNGEETTITAASRWPSEVRRVEAGEGVIAVLSTERVEESWESYESEVELVVSLERAGVVGRHFKVGDAVELVVRLEKGYRAGDLLHVCLPAALSKIHGGGQVKRFSVDFAGQSEVRVSLAATGITLARTGAPGPQRYAICVRNMFEEERVGNPGPLQVTVAPQRDGTHAEAIAGIRRFL